MGKTLAGPLVQDSALISFGSLVDPATGTCYAPRARNLTTDANGDTAAAEVVLYGSDGAELAKAEDAAHSSGDRGIMGLAVRKDTAAALAGTDGDYIPLIVDSTGRLWVNSELPEARLAADNLALPTAPDVLATLMGHDGTNQDLVRVGVADGAAVAGVLGTMPLLYRSDIPALYRQRGAASLITANDGLGLPAAQMAGYNGAAFGSAGFDLWRNNIEGTLLASAASTTNRPSPNAFNYNGDGKLNMVLRVTASPGGGQTLQVFVHAIDPISGNGVNIVVFTAIAATAFPTLYNFQLGPGLTQSLLPVGGNTAFANVFVPRTFQVDVEHSGAGSWTYSLSYGLTN